MLGDEVFKGEVTLVFPNMCVQQLLLLLDLSLRIVFPSILAGKCPPCSITIPKSLKGFDRGGILSACVASSRRKYRSELSLWNSAWVCNAHAMSSASTDLCLLE